MDIAPEMEDQPDAKDFSEGDIVFHDVSFHYPDHDKNVLTSLNLRIPKGKSVALVGPSGSGKTTLCNLIPRFYQISSGKITIGGTDIYEMSQKALRSHIGMVQQDVYLFSGTIRENIEYGRPGADFSEIVCAAKDAGADEFIRELPDGYDTYVGERGINPVFRKQFFMCSLFFNAVLGQN